MNLKYKTYLSQTVNYIFKMNLIHYKNHIELLKLILNANALKFSNQMIIDNKRKLFLHVQEIILK